MKQERAIGVSLVLAMALAGVAWVMLPSLEAAPQFVEREAGVHIERARRLFHQYNANLGYQSLLVGTLRDMGVDAEAWEDASDEAADIYQEAHTELWETYTPTNLPHANEVFEALATDNSRIEPARKATANYGNIDGQVGPGVLARQKMIAANEGILKEAAIEVGDALMVTSGGVDGRSHAEATRLKAIIEYYQGLSLRLQAGLKRNQAEVYRRELADVAGRVGALTIAQSLLEDSEIDSKIAVLSAEADGALRNIREREASLKATEDKIADIESRIASAQKRRDKARKTLDRVRGAGINFSDPDGARTFTAQVTEQDRVYREAVREMESLRAGGYPYAQIDATGDYVNGLYLENGSAQNLTIEPGLTHYQSERDVAVAELESARHGVEGIQEGVAQLDEMREAIVRQQNEARDSIVAIRPDSAEILDDLITMEDEASALENEAIARFSASAKSSRSAASLVSAWISDAQDKTQSLPQEKQEFSGIHARTKATWMGGHIAAQGADAELAKAWIHYDQYLSATKNAALFAWLPEDLGLTDADPGEETEIAEEARDFAVEAVEAVHTILERAHRDAERHWTLVAQGAGATYILALLGDESYVADTIDGYREALKGRETDPFTQRLASRLRQLESR